MTDVVTPGYYATRRDGGILPTNEMHQTKDVVVRDGQGYHMWVVRNSSTQNVEARGILNGSMADSYHWYLNHFNGKIPYQGTYTDWPSSDAPLTSALARARTDAWDVATFLAEFNKTVSMIARFRSNVFRRAHNIVHSRQRTIAERGMIGFSETWLEARYGWRTLIYDMADINQSLEKLRFMSAGYIRKSDTVTASDSTTVASHGGLVLTYYSPFLYNSVGNICYASGNVSQTIERRVRAGVIVELMATNILTLDPLLTAWEVVPFSFIVDWFFNINKAIAAYSPFATGSVLSAWSSTSDVVVTTTECTMQDPYFAYNPAQSYAEVLGTQTDSIVHTRTIYNRQEEDPSFNLSVDINLDWSKLLDLAALFILQRARLIQRILSISRT
jgi:hypothetical protein